MGTVSACLVMEHSITHFEIYGDDPQQIAEFYGHIFGWRVEQMPGLSYWRIFPQANETGPLHGGVTHRALSGLNGWLLYVNVASLDETVELVQQLGGSVVRKKTAIPKVAWVTIVADPANNIFGVWQSDPTAFPTPMPD